MEQVKAITTEQEAETAVQYIVVRIGNEQYGINIKYIVILSGTKRLPACQRHRHIIKVSSICAVKLFRL